MRTRTILAAATLLVALFVAGLAPGDDDSKKKDTKPKEPTAAQLRIAKSMSEGHSYDKHVVEEKLFPDVKSKDEFAKVIGKVLANPTHHRKLENDREAYYDSKSNTIVIYNPHARDKGTCFKPRAGLRYFENLK
ncbi:MAG TPA: hypothetical protein VL371_13340 [Gemmataceae bacterium]|jgi:pyocin large subunit-like protein|nr:hypothetical protein [Gemmataceae bacterium]